MSKPDQFYWSRIKEVGRARSPLSESRWSLLLDCGHRRWMTSVKMPKTGDPAECFQCEKKP